MINAEVTPNGNLRLFVASNEDREDLAELKDYDHWDDVDVLRHGMEPYWTNGGFHPFDAGQANPFVGLTSAPCIAESMDTDDDGKNHIVGRLWWFPQYETTSPLDELTRKGEVIFTLAP